jgi:hypothetical protein
MNFTRAGTQRLLLHRRCVSCNDGPLKLR